ncbi:hypothetical protein SFRURICE_009881 [Spodoptera frugiperda]|nr:hypothetical protein SFRURICE_009881 [Spodoptera frugiperda]
MEDDPTIKLLVNSSPFSVKFQRKGGSSDQARSANGEALELSPFTNRTVLQLYTNCQTVVKIYRLREPVSPKAFV